MSPDDDLRDELGRGLGAPLLLVFWTLVLWGTLYGALLLMAMVTEGPATVLQRVLCSHDRLATFINLGSAATAPLVWLVVGIAIWRARARSTQRVTRHRKGY